MRPDAQYDTGGVRISKFGTASVIFEDGLDVVPGDMINARGGVNRVTVNG